MSSSSSKVSLSQTPKDTPMSNNSNPKRSTFETPANKKERLYQLKSKMTDKELDEEIALLKQFMNTLSTKMETLIDKETAKRDKLERINKQLDKNINDSQYQQIDKEVEQENQVYKRQLKNHSKVKRKLQQLQNKNYTDKVEEEIAETQRQISESKKRIMGLEVQIRQNGKRLITFEDEATKQVAILKEELLMLRKKLDKKKLRAAQLDKKISKIRHSTQQSTETVLETYVQELSPKSTETPKTFSTPKQQIKLVVVNSKDKKKQEETQAKAKLLQKIREDIQMIDKKIELSKRQLQTSKEHLEAVQKLLPHGRMSSIS